MIKYMRKINRIFEINFTHFILFKDLFAGLSLD